MILLPKSPSAVTVSRALCGSRGGSELLTLCLSHEDSGAPRAFTWPTPQGHHGVLASRSFFPAPEEVLSQLLRDPVSSLGMGSPGHKLGGAWALLLQPGSCVLGSDSTWPTRSSPAPTFRARVSAISVSPALGTL